MENIKYNDYLENLINEKYWKFIESIRESKNIYNPIMDNKQIKI